MFLWPLSGDSLGKIVTLWCVLSPARNQQLWWFFAAVQAVGIGSRAFKSESCNGIAKSCNCAVCLLL